MFDKIKKVIKNDNNDNNNDIYRSGVWLLVRSPENQLIWTEDPDDGDIVFACMAVSTGDATNKYKEYINSEMRWLGHDHEWLITNKRQLRALLAMV